MSIRSKVERLERWAPPRAGPVAPPVPSAIMDAVSADAEAIELATRIQLEGFPVEAVMTDPWARGVVERVASIVEGRACAWPRSRASRRDR